MRDVNLRVLGCPQDREGLGVGPSAAKQVRKIHDTSGRDILLGQPIEAGPEVRTAAAARFNGHVLAALKYLRFLHARVHVQHDNALRVGVVNCRAHMPGELFQQRGVDAAAGVDHHDKVAHRLAIASG